VTTSCLAYAIQIKDCPKNIIFHSVYTPFKILMGCSNQEKILGTKMDTVLMAQEYQSLQPSTVSIQNLPQVTASFSTLYTKIYFVIFV
jgi:hypothetical protein